MARRVRSLLRTPNRQPTQLLNINNNQNLYSNESKVGVAEEVTHFVFESSTFPFIFHRKCIVWKKMNKESISTTKTTNKHKYHSISNKNVQQSTNNLTNSIKIEALK